jgi:hypothetical protein
MKEGMGAPILYACYGFVPSLRGGGEGELQFPKFPRASFPGAGAPPALPAPPAPLFR